MSTVKYFFTRFGFILIIFVLIGILGILVIITAPKKTVTNNISSVTPTAIPVKWREYSDTTNHYYVPFPTQWITPVPDEQTRESDFTFMENGKEYRFSIMLGNALPEAGLIGADRVQTYTAYYAKKSFLKQVYIRNNIPFLVVAVPDQTDFHFYAFSLEIPASRPDYYLNLFDTMMSQLVIGKLPQISDVVSPTM